MAIGRLGIVWCLIFLAAWLWLHPPVPPEANGDIYDHLAAARNLLRGEGLSVDVVYPLSTAFDWGRQLPQPMLHRQPGLALLLTPLVAATADDPDRAPDAVRILQLVLLAGLAWTGLLGLRRRAAGWVGPLWLLVLLASPLLGLAVDWGWIEIPCALVLLGFWLRLRDRDPLRRGRNAALVDGLLAGVLTLLRTDLVWIPVLWWLAAAVCAPRRERRPVAALLPHLAVAAGVWLVVTLPWWLHVWLTAGSPTFNPLVYSLQLDLSENWWEYPRLRGLEPLAPLANLRENFVPALIKTRHGIRFYAETLGHWLPWGVWLASLGLGAAMWRRRRRHGFLKPGPWAVLALTLTGLVPFYALISQEVRHLLVLAPVLAWETALLAARAAGRRRWSVRRRVLIVTAVTVAALALTPMRPEGDLAHRATAIRQAPRIAALAEEVRSWPPGPVFTDAAAVCWLSDRRGVWSPYDAPTEIAIRGTVPGMGDARWVRLGQP